MLAAVGLDGPGAPLVIDGPVDADVFRTYVERVLVPQLGQGDLVVMDNLSPHKAGGIQESIEAVGAEVWYLPPYSPDLNPIERVWKLARKLCTHNQYFPLLSDLVAAVASQLNRWSRPNPILSRLCGII